MQKYWKNGIYEGPNVLKKNWDTWRSQSIEKNMMSTRRLIEEETNDSHVLEWKFMREIIHIKEYNIGLTLFYPHTCTSWSKGMTSFSLDLSFDFTKYAD